MKKIFLLSMLMFTLLSFSQVDRRVGRTPHPNVSKKQEKVDPIQVSLNYLKKELTLDTFQEAATKTFLEETQKEKEYILSLDISESDKVDKLKKSIDKFDHQLSGILNPKQKESIEKLKAKQNGSNKKKKNNKENVDELENQ